MPDSSIPNGAEPEPKPKPVAPVAQVAQAPAPKPVTLLHSVEAEAATEAKTLAVSGLADLKAFLGGKLKEVLLVAAIAFFALVVLKNLAHAEDNSCTTVAHLQEVAAAHSLKLEALDPSSLQVLLEHSNKPPGAHVTSGYYAVLPTGDYLVAFVYNGCAVAYSAVGKELFESLLHSKAGLDI